jgi:hypothetical protein
VSAPALEGAIEIVGAASRPAAEPGTRVVSATMSADLVQRVIAKAAFVRLPVRGEAMQPTLRSGDRVTLAPPARPPARGDLVALRTGDGLVIRRYVGRSSEGSIATASDNVDTVEAPVPETALSGLVVAVERCGRRVELGSGTRGVIRKAVVALARRCSSTARELARRTAG